ncbi:MAG TPA: hypothetical protein VGP79_14220 [Bryobacteraceae bacterium]|jgi:hypothetical protein|nr:hypothetical protein [Bryobacteraceae bacterium]
MADVLEWMIGEILGASNEGVVENHLFDLEVRLSVGGADERSAAAQALRETAPKCWDAARGERLLRAADAIDANQSVARNEQGLTLAEAKQVSTITAQEWEKIAPNWPTEKPAEIPHLSAWDLFPGLEVRVVEGFSDFDRNAVNAGELLHFHDLNHFSYDDGYTITFRERIIRLSGNVDADAVILANHANRFLEPVPTVDSLKACFGSIQQLWRSLKLQKKWQAPIVRGELDACGRWLAEKGERDDPYVCTSWPLLPSLFPERTTISERLIFQITFLFAGIVRCPDGRTPPAT